MTDPLNSEIHICLAFDQNYLTPVYVLLTSVFYNNKQNGLVFHFIATGITKEEQADLKRFIQTNKADVLFYPIDEAYIEKNITLRKGLHYTLATYHKLLFANLVPESIERLIYIDADAVVIDDLRGLYQINIDGFPVGAVADPYPVIRKELGIHQQGSYFNAGVLLINTKYWRDQKITEKALQFAIQHPDKLRFEDQDALNAVLLDNWVEIDQRYNVNWLDVKLQVPRKELIKDKVIIHYTSQWKPWHCLARNKLRGLYHFYLKLSPRSYEKKYTDFKWQIGIIKSYVRIRAKEFYFDKRIDKLVPIKSLKMATRDY
jgi:lipopolysaccharide biosynthesis glycosyltransferase